MIFSVSPWAEHPVGAVMSLGPEGARSLSCLQRDCVGSAGVSDRNDAFLACPAGPTVNALGCHSQETFTPQPLPARKENTQRQGGNHATPPFFPFSVSFCENIKSGWKCIYGASLQPKRTPATSLGDARWTKSTNASLLAVAVRFGPQSYLRCTNKSGGPQLSPARPCPFPIRRLLAVSSWPSAAPTQSSHQYALLTAAKPPAVSCICSLNHFSLFWKPVFSF